MFAFIDSGNINDLGETTGPILNNSRLSVYGFFLIFIFVGTFFLVNLFVGVIQLNYHLAEEAAKNKYLSDDQTKWIEVQKLILEVKPDFASIKPPENFIR